MEFHGIQKIAIVYMVSMLFHGISVELYGIQVNGAMLFKNMNCNYFCLLEIPNSQLKPANLHKQNDRRPKRVLPYIDYRA